MSAAWKAVRKWAAIFLLRGFYFEMAAEAHGGGIEGLIETPSKVNQINAKYKKEHN
jgi:hypothetical protein